MRAVGEHDRRGRGRHRPLAAAACIAVALTACATQRPVLGEVVPTVASTPAPTVAPAAAGLNPPVSAAADVPLVTVDTVTGRVDTATPATTATIAATTATTAAAGDDGVAPYRRPGWVGAENAKPGTDAWKITTDTASAQIEGYADTTSATGGDTVTLFVATSSPSWHAEAFRMGFYGGAGGRLVWSSTEQHTEWQRFTTPDAKTGLAEAGWDPSLRVPIDASWPPGAYLVKLTSSGGGAHYVPITIRDDEAAPASMLVVNAVTTWQAYNEWGGCSAYKCPFVKGLDRGSRISFDRPYAHAYNKGAADFLDHERPLIAFAEELGLDLAYATSVDLDAHPELARRHRAVLTLGHDEYYSAAMRQALVDARDNGVNLAFFGANAVYRQIRLEPSSTGRARRVLVNYRSNADPIAKTDPKLVTVEWHSLGHPAQELTGMAYQCADVSGDVVLTNTANWVFAGAGASDGMVLRSLAGNEIDGIVADRFTPTNIERLGRMRVPCGKDVASGAMAYYSAPSGAGVFSTGTIWWVCGLDAEFCSVPANVPVVRAVTANVLRAFAAGPTGVAHPSAGSTGKG